MKSLFKNIDRKDYKKSHIFSADTVEPVPFMTPTCLSQELFAYIQERVRILMLS